MTRMDAVRKSDHYADLWRVFTSTIRWLAAATVVALIGLLVDRDKHPAIDLVYATSFVVLVAALRVLRLMMVFEGVVTIMSGPSKARPGGS